VRKDGRSQLVKLANNPPANAADRKKAVHDGPYASDTPFRQVFRQPRRSTAARHDVAATSPGIVPKRPDFSPVNPRIYETNEPFRALSDQSERRAELRIRPSGRDP
jgi:hypothetical protein